ncbi:hypothetical protein MF406_05890 [Georgenia sp. TF02-10]|uniref:TIGR03089 family protein n=1 Tax=Georgenia sp. TF02-10 TaxID=2917725 RepID=UPI001FA7119C|nr:TIGR03089 family protein [Georgenia sp. TF02-10]UNX55766.1 hypothetical protein MF406_05890 [Georgenia sp. TF02-10]
MSLHDTLPGHLLGSFTGAAGTSPRLTWYGADGERVELSGRVLANWVTKAANLLVEEADAEPGTTVLLDLPVHWRVLVWALGSWTAGATVVLPGDLEEDDEDGERPAVVITHRPGEAPGTDAADLVLAVALPALAMRWDGATLPVDVVDAAAELMTFGDELGYVSEPDPDDLALVAEDLEVTFGELGGWAGERAAADGGLVGGTGIADDEVGELGAVGVGPDGAVADAVGDDGEGDVGADLAGDAPADDEVDADDALADDEVPETDDDGQHDGGGPTRVLLSPGTVEELLEQVLAVWTGGGSVVLVEPGTPRETRQRVAAEEHAEPR